MSATVFGIGQADGVFKKIGCVAIHAIRAKTNLDAQLAHLETTKIVGKPAFTAITMNSDVFRQFFGCLAEHMPLLCMGTGPLSDNLCQINEQGLCQPPELSISYCYC